MEYICGMTYAPFARKGSYQEKSAFDSLKKMKEIYMGAPGSVLAVYRRL